MDISHGGRDVRSQRHRTAIRRYKLSRPLQSAEENGLVRPAFSVFDYGCGHGEDVAILKRRGLRATGWDPHYRPGTELASADIVNLGYVLNVIENTDERRATLQHAYKLASRVLVVAVRVEHALGRGTPLYDGVVTERGSFQKIFTQQEFKEYVEGVLRTKPYMADLGVAYIFKDAKLEAEFLASLAVRRPLKWIESVLSAFRKDRVAQRFIRAAKDLGRLPIAGEFASYEKLTERFGPPHRIARIAQALLSEGEIASVRAAKKEDLLLYFGMVRLQGLKAPPFRSLPAPLQADIRMLWPSYQSALEDGDKFLYQLGNAAAVQRLAQGTLVGKRLPDALYVHRSCSNELPPLLRLVLFAAAQVVGDVEHDLIKLALDGRKVSFLL